MERVEVLRGPQGTLYGDGSIAGTVRVIPNAPDLTTLSGEIAGNSSSTAGEGGDNTMLRGVLNMPVVKDTFAIRVVAYDYDNSGYYKSVAGSNADKQIWVAPSAESQRIRATSVVTNTPGEEYLHSGKSPRPSMCRYLTFRKISSNGGYLNLS